MALGKFRKIFPEKSPKVNKGDGSFHWDYELVHKVPPSPAQEWNNALAFHSFLPVLVSVDLACLAPDDLVLIPNLKARFHAGFSLSMDTLKNNMGEGVTRKLNNAQFAVSD
jgi:hypothetical protein